jgi:hypothetical protein
MTGETDRPDEQVRHTEDADAETAPGDDQGRDERPADAAPNDVAPADPSHAREAGADLAAIAPNLRPQRPPRRTGVFIDPDDLRTHVGGLLRSVLGGYEVDAFGNFTFTHEGARVFVTVGGSPVGPQVGIFCVTNLDIDLSPPLASFLLTTNHTLGFGSFSYDLHNRAIWLRHTLLGTTLDLPELQTAVAAIATTAAGIDERIRDRFGGRTFQDAPGDVQRGMEPPEPSQEQGVGGGAGGYL